MIHIICQFKRQKRVEKQKALKFERSAQIMDLMCKNHRASFNKYKIFINYSNFIHLLNYDLVK
jgi:hypothetical protein